MEMLLKGDAELLQQFRGMPNLVRKKLMRNALKAGAGAVSEVAKSLVPVQSGALREGISVQKMKRRRNSIGWFVSTPTREELAKGQETAERAEQVYGEEGYYPAVVEFGSQHVGARPYMRPAAEQARPQVIALAVQDIREALNGKPRADESDVDDDGVDPDAPVYTGKRGGRYRISRSGKKVYVSRFELL